jgi:hypothetical protein
MEAKRNEILSGKKKVTATNERTNQLTERKEWPCFLRRLQPKNKGLSQVPIG